MNWKELKIVGFLLLLGFCLLGLTSMAINVAAVPEIQAESNTFLPRLLKQGFNPIKERKKRKRRKFKKTVKKANTLNKNKSVPPLHGERSQLTAFLLCILLGVFGAHRFYTGQIGWGVLQLCSFGCCGVFVVIDLVLIVLNRLSTKDGQDLISW
jgi:hypothetical protein